jgi:hypothetical protein
VNALSRSPKTGILTIIRYIFNIIIEIIGKAGKGLKMRDIPVECFVKLRQVRYSYGGVSGLGPSPPAISRDIQVTYHMTSM